MSETLLTRPMTRQELRLLLNKMWGCACGQPEAAAAALLRLLRLHPLYDHRAELEAWIPDDGVRTWLLYTLDRFELTEHGGSVGGGWLTDQGRAVLYALSAEEADDFDALLKEHCVHGYNMDDQEHECS